MNANGGSQKRLREKLSGPAQEMQWPLMLTLSGPPSRSCSVKAQRKLMRAFARLRRTKAFEPSRGGVAALEITPSGKRFHIHIHAVVDAKWLNQDALETAWQRAIGSHGVIHLQRIRLPVAALEYITKAEPLKVWGSHMLTCWGNVRKAWLAANADVRVRRLLRKGAL